MVKTLVISVILIAVAIVTLGFRILFTKGGKFPSGHAHEIESRRKAALAEAERRKQLKNQKQH